MRSFMKIVSQRQDGTGKNCTEYLENAFQENTGM